MVRSMSLQKKQYRSAANRSRGGVKGKRLDTSATANGHTPKDYGRNVRSFHGSKTDAVQEELNRQIIRKKKYG